MYKFTNGLVVYDKQTRDKFLKAGYKLAKSNKSDKNAKKDEVTNENDSNSGTIENQSKERNKQSK